MSTPHHNDRFEQFRAGSRDAFKYYYDLYVERIHFFLQERTGDWSAATDKTQEVFIILYNDRQKINNEGHIRPFLYTVAKNLAMEYLREKGSLKEFQAELTKSAEAQKLAPEFHKAEEVKGEVLMALRMSWLSLPAKKRRIVVLYYSHNKSTAEIASRLGIDVQTVRNHLAQSIILLRKSFDGRWEEINLFFS